MTIALLNTMILTISQRVSPFYHDATPKLQLNFFVCSTRSPPHSQVVVRRTHEILKCCKPLNTLPVLTLKSPTPDTHKFSNATMSCVCSTRGTPQAMNSHLLLCTPPGLHFALVPPLGLNFCILLSLFFLNTHFSLAPPELWSLLRSPLLLLSRLALIVLTRLLRSLLFLTRLLVAFFYLL